MQNTGAYMRPIASSFPLQIFLTISIYFAPCWWAVTFSLLIYKASVLPYPPTALAFEIITTFLLWLIQYWAVRLSKRGNLTENSGIIVFGIILTVFAIGGLFFYIFGQTYVTRLDEGFSVTLLVLDFINLILAFVAMQGFGAAPMMPQTQQQQAEQQQMLFAAGAGAGGGGINNPNMANAVNNNNLQQQQQWETQQQQQQQQQQQMQQQQMLMMQHQQQQMMQQQQPNTSMAAAASAQQGQNMNDNVQQGGGGGGLPAGLGGPVGGSIGAGAVGDHPKAE